MSPSYFTEHVLEVCLGMDPGSDSIAEEDEILDNSGWVHSNHETHTPEGRILLLIVTDVSQRGAPTQHEWGKLAFRQPGKQQT